MNAGGSYGYVDVYLFCRKQIAKRQKAIVQITDKAQSNIYASKQIPKGVVKKQANRRW